MRGRDVQALGAHFVPFSAQTRMSGVDLDGRRIRKGAADAIERFVREQGGELPNRRARRRRATWRARAARRSSSRTARACSASSSSRTS